MSLTNFKPEFDNSYQLHFNKTNVAKEVMNTRFESKLKYGESVERVAFDVSGVRVRDAITNGASTFDDVTDSSELLNINIKREVAVRIYDDEVTQAGPLNPGVEIGKQIAIKVANDLDARAFGEVVNATQTFDAGDLTTMVSNGTAITIDATTTPQMVFRMSSKLSRGENVTGMNNLVFVIDSYGAGDVEQYLAGKNIDIAGSVFKNGYAGPIRGAIVYVSENLTGETVLTGTSNLSDGETIVYNGITFTAVSTIGSTAGNFLIGANLAATLTNLEGLINAPDTTSSTQVALAASDAAIVELWTATATSTTVTTVMKGAGRPIVSETSASASFTSAFFHAYFGKRRAIDLVIQDLKEVDMRVNADRRATSLFSNVLAGVKTFVDGAKQFLDVHINA